MRSFLPLFFPSFFHKNTKNSTFSLQDSHILSQKPLFFEIRPENHPKTPEKPKSTLELRETRPQKSAIFRISRNENYKKIKKVKFSPTGFPPCFSKNDPFSRLGPKTLQKRGFFVFFWRPENTSMGLSKILRKWRYKFLINFIKKVIFWSKTRHFLKKHPKRDPPKTEKWWFWVQKSWKFRSKMSSKWCQTKPKIESK